MLTDNHKHSGSSLDGNKVKTSVIEGILSFVKGAVSTDSVGLKYNVGRIDPTISGGDESYTDVGFKPKCLIMFGFAANTWVGANQNYFTYGFTDGTNEYCLSKNQRNSTTHIFQSIENYLTYNGLDSTHFTSSILKTFDSDGFTLTWDGDSTPADGDSVSNGRYTYLAIG